MRLGARKFTSQEGFDYVEFFSPIMKMTYLQILFALDILYDYHIHQMDIKLLHSSMAYYKICTLPNLKVLLHLEMKQMCVA
jgi:hypothetical protein